MSQSAEAAYLLKSRGVSNDLGAFVVAARFSQDGRRVAFALGDGTIHIAGMGGAEAWVSAKVHDGSVLTVASDPAGDGFVSGGDDGKLNRLAADGTVSELADFGMKWVEHVATHALDKGKGLIAASAGKIVRLFDQSG